MPGPMKPTIELDGGGNLRIRFPFDRSLVDLVKTLPRRRWHALEKYWSAPAGDVVAVLDTLVPRGFSCDGATAKLYREQGGKAPIASAAPSLFPDPPENSSDVPALLTDPPGPLQDEPAPAGDFTVAELNRTAAAALRAAFPSTVWVTGEISGFNKSAHRKHVGFKLVERDENGTETAQVNAILFQGARAALQEKLRAAGDPFALEDEITVRVQVEVQIFEAWGQYRVRIDDLDLNYTLGEAARRREEIIRRLAEEGLLAKNLSLPLPPLPLRVGLITSLGSDAQNDVVRSLEESGFGFQVTVHGARVQGRSTEPSVLNGLDWFRERREEFDVVMICRGGGSRTDLAWFDNEALGRAVAGFPLPVVIGIGHEQDSSVLDALARSAKTPTAAAGLLAEQVARSLEVLEQAGFLVLEQAAAAIRDEERRGRERESRLVRASRGVLDHAAKDTRHQGSRLLLATRNLLSRAEREMESVMVSLPRTVMVRLAAGRTDLDRVESRLTRASMARIQQANEPLNRAAAVLGPRAIRAVVLEEERLEARQRRLALCDPARVVERGFAVLRLAGGPVLRHPKDAPEGTVVEATLKGGRLGLRSTGPVRGNRKKGREP